MKNILLFGWLILLLGCDATQHGSTITTTQFDLKITGDIQGAISNIGMAAVACENDRTIITFSESIENLSEKSDSVIGEIILAFQKEDSIGTFPLQGIAEKRAHHQVGIVGILNFMTFDDLAATYVADEHRYQTVEEGEVNIKVWDKNNIQGSIDAVLEENAKKIRIKGDFKLKLQPKDEICW